MTLDTGDLDQGGDSKTISGQSGYILVLKSAEPADCLTVWGTEKEVTKDQPQVLGLSDLVSCGQVGTLEKRVSLKLTLGY